MDIGKRIKQCCEVLNLKQLEFAEQCKIPQSSLSRVINGKNMPEIDVLQKIAGAFPELNIRWILLGEGDIKISNLEIFENKNNEMHEPQAEYGLPPQYNEVTVYQEKVCGATGGFCPFGRIPDLESQLAAALKENEEFKKQLKNKK